MRDASPHFESSEDGPVLQLIEYPDGVVRVAGVVDPQDMPLAVRVLSMPPGKFYWPRDLLMSGFAPCQKAITNKIKESEPDAPPTDVASSGVEQQSDPRVRRVGAL